MLTFKGRMLNIYDAACTLRWPKVQCNLRRAGMKFFRGHGVYLSRKHTNPLWVPRKGLAFVRSNDDIYGGPGFQIICVHT
jgi:hypothetical protein